MLIPSEDTPLITITGNEGPLVLDLLEESLDEPAPLSRAERVAKKFHNDCIAALRGIEMPARDFAKSPEFQTIKGNLRKQVGETMSWTIMADWFHANKNLFSKQKNVT